MKYFLNKIENAQGQQTLTTFEVEGTKLLRVASIAPEKEKTWTLTAQEAHQFFFELNKHIFQLENITQEEFETIWLEAQKINPQNKH